MKAVVMSLRPEAPTLTMKRPPDKGGGQGVQTHSTTHRLPYYSAGPLWIFKEENIWRGRSSTSWSVEVAPLCDDEQFKVDASVFTRSTADFGCHAGFLTQLLGIKVETIVTISQTVFSGNLPSLLGWF